MSEIPDIIDLGDIPQEALMKIVLYLDVVNIKRLAVTSKEFFDNILTEHLFKMLLVRDFNRMIDIDDEMDDGDHIKNIERSNMENIRPDFSFLEKHLGYRYLYKTLYHLRCRLLHNMRDHIGSHHEQKIRPDDIKYKVNIVHHHLNENQLDSDDDSDIEPEFHTQMILTELPVVKHLSRSIKFVCDYSPHILEARAHHMNVVHQNILIKEELLKRMVTKRNIVIRNIIRNAGGGNPPLNANNGEDVVLRRVDGENVVFRNVNGVDNDHPFGNDGDLFLRDEDEYIDSYGTGPPHKEFNILVFEGICSWIPSLQVYRLIYPMSALRLLFEECKKNVLAEHETQLKKAREQLAMKAILHYKLTDNPDNIDTKAYAGEISQFIASHIRNYGMKITSAVVEDGLIKLATVYDVKPRWDDSICISYMCNNKKKTRYSDCLCARHKDTDVGYFKHMRMERTRMNKRQLLSYSANPNSWHTECTVVITHDYRLGVVNGLANRLINPKVSVLRFNRVHMEFIKE